MYKHEFTCQLLTRGAAGTFPSRMLPDKDCEGRNRWMNGLRRIPQIAGIAVMLIGALFQVGCSKSDAAKLVQFAEKGDLHAFQAEINKGFDAKEWNTGAGQFDTTPLHAAAHLPSAAIVCVLLDRGMNPQIHVKDGTSPMDVAIVSGSSEVVTELLKRGVSADAPLRDDKTPLTLAVLAGNTNIIKLLLRSGTDVNRVTGEYNSRMTPLALAAGLGNAEIVELLIAAGARVNVPVSDGISPLDSVVFNKEPDMKMISLLVKHGAEAQFTTVSYAREHLGKKAATALLASIHNPIVQRVTRDTACKDCPIPKNELVDLIMKLGAEKNKER
jgi:hypothetical protein